MSLLDSPEDSRLHTEGSTSEDATLPAVTAVTGGRGQGLTAHASGKVALAATKPMGPFYSLRFRDYRLLWIGTLFSSAGQWIQGTTMGWVVYDLTGSSTLLGAVNGMRAIPMLFLSPLGGVAADRVDRKLLMFGTQAFLMLVSFGLAVGLALNQVRIGHLFIFTFLTGIAWALNQPVRQTVVFSIVPRYAVANAVALTSSAFNATRTLGPTVAGFLIGWFGPAGNFFVQSAMYLGVSVSILLMVVPATKSTTGKQSLKKDMVDGFRYAVHDRVILTLMALGLFSTFFGMPYMSLLPVFARDVYHSGPRSYGLLLSAVGAGALLGALFTASFGTVVRAGLLQLIALVALGLGLLAFAAMHAVWTATLFLVVTGFCQMTFQSLNQVLLQMNTPDELRGRITSLYMLNVGLIPLGTLIGGVSAEFFGAPKTVAAMGMLCIALAAVIFVRMPQVRAMHV